MDEEAIKTTMRLMGKKGGNATKAKYGKEYYHNMLVERWRKWREKKAKENDIERSS